MLCDMCKLTDAVVHITKIENGKRTELHLCAACAKKQGTLGGDHALNIVDNDFSVRWLMPIMKGRLPMNRAAAAAA